MNSSGRIDYRPGHAQRGITTRSLGLAALFFAACSPTAKLPPLSAAAEGVEVAKVDPPRGAVLIGPVEATHGTGCGILGKRGTSRAR